MAAYEVPPSPDYIPGPEVPPSPDYIPGPDVPPSPNYIPGPRGVREDEILPAEEQPLPAAASPTTDSPGYVPESDPEEEPKEDDEDPEEDPADYPADRDDDDDEDENEDEDEEEEEEHPAPADSIPPVHRMTASEGPGEFSSQLLQDGPAVAREDPYSIAMGDLYGFVDIVDVTPRHPMSRELDYGITDTWDDLVGAIDEIAPTTLEGVNQRVTDLATHCLSMRLPAMPVYRRLAVMIEREAKMAHEAWGLSMDASDYARSDVMSLRTTVMAQSALISELQTEDHRRQRDYRHRWSSFRGSMDPQKAWHSLRHQERLVAVPRFGYVVAMLCSLLSIMGYSQLADCIDLLFCLATQYRKWHQKRRTTRLNPSATPTPVIDTHTITSVTNAQIQAMINEGVTAALAARDATWNGDDSHTSGTGVKRPVQVAS
ncbi:hypothetical protein Tco_1174600 [Tanacetum coccineum]